MNDNEIKRIIDASTENPESGGTKISAEEVKSLVMTRIGGKNKADICGENEVFVEPTFVTVSGKRKPRFKIAAAAAAACMGIVCVGGYFAFGGSNGDLINGGSGSDIVLSTSEEEPAVTDEEENVFTINLVDGTQKKMYSSGEVINTTYERDILVLRENRLWFIGNGESIDVAAAAGDNSYYIYTYFNKDNEKEHKVIISNTVNADDCGYFEMYLQEDVEGLGRWVAYGKNCFSVSPRWDSAIAEGYKQWVYDALESLGLSAFDASLSENNADEERDLGNYVYITGSAVPILGYPNINGKQTVYLMMDGERINYVEKNNNGESQAEHYGNVSEILEIRDNCLWVKSKGMEDMNITELAKGKEYYIYSDYCDNRLHTFVVRNTTVPEECGYFEVYNVDTWYFGKQAVGRNIDDISFGFIAAKPNKYKDWVCNALEELGLEITEDYSAETLLNDKAVHMDSWELPYKVPVISGTEEVKSLPGGYALAEKFELMSGDTVRLAYVPNDPCPRLLDFNHKGNGNLFVTENGRLFFIGNNEHIDITDEIGKDKAYIYSYTNPVRNKLHYIVAGGSAENFAYAEIFPIGEDETNEVRWASCGVGMECADGSPSDADMGKLMSSALNSLNIVSPDEMYYADAFSLTVDENGVSENVADGGDLNQGVPPLPDGVILDEEFKLLDSSVVRFVHKEDETGSTSAIYPLQNANLFANENGRTYFVGNGEHIDITDSIDSDRAYIYTYTHPERNSLHYFIVGGNADNFGYAEVYPGPGENQWICNGTNCWFADDEEMIAESQKNSDSGAKVFSVKVYRPWLKSALNELANRYGIILTQSNNSNHSNGFTYLFSAE